MKRTFFIQGRYLVSCLGYTRLLPWLYKAATLVAATLVRLLPWLATFVGFGLGCTKGWEGQGIDLARRAPM